MTSTHRKGPCPPDHDAAAVLFDDHSGNPASRKAYIYWVPKHWNVQPGDKLKVFVSEREELKSVTVQEMHPGSMLRGCEHKLAVSCQRNPGVVMDEWPTDPPPAMTSTPVWDDMKTPTARDMRDQMAYYMQGFRPSQLPKFPCPYATKETIMEIQHQTLVNGRNIKDMTDDQLFDLIADEEAKIKALRAIENKPQKLKDRINKMQADIEHLIKLIDER